MVVSGELGSATTSQLPAELPSTVLVPVGSTEQHGPHLPLDTDTRIATAVARQAVRQLAAVADAGIRRQYLLAPAIGYGDSGEHQSFPGTISIGTEALTLLLLEYGRSAACWAQRILFVNGHGGNVAALGCAVRRLRAEARDAAWQPCAVEGGDAHAGHSETSLLLYISPAVVRADKYRTGNRAALSELMPAMRRGGIAAVSEVGVLGDPTTATAAEGERLFAAMVDRCVRAVRNWGPSANGLLR